MPRKHNRGGRGGRGGGRGCRGGKRGGGRGGYIGGKANKYNKRGGHGGAGRGGRGGYGGQPVNADYPELGDLSNPDFISFSHPEKTMRATARRTRNRSRLQDEAFNTDENRESTMNLPLRKRPVLFVLASTYDPTQNLMKILSKKDRGPPSEERNDRSTISNDVDLEAIKNEDMEKDLRPESPSGSKEQFDEEPQENYDEAEISVEDTKAEDQFKSAKKTILTVPDDQLFFVDEAGQPPAKVRAVEVDETQIIKPVKPGSNTEFEPVLSIGHIRLSTRVNEKGETETTLPAAGKRLNNLKSFNADQSIYEVDDEDGDDDPYDVNQPKTEELYKSYNNYISKVMENLDSNDEDGSDEGDDFYDELDEDFEEEAKFIANLSSSDDEGNDSGEATNYNPDHATSQLENLNIEEGEAIKEPEYGFLSEDYESFDNSLVDIINVRYGNPSNQYHLKCFQMTGTYEFLWIDQDIFTDFLLENGMPEHRLTAYFNYVHAQLTPEELDERDFDLPISDSSDEELEDEYERGQDSSDEEGLDDLIQFTKRYDGVRDMDIEPTQSLTTRGKGKKKELDLDHIADDVLRDRLANQYQAMRESKKERKKKRDSNINNEHAKSVDLSLKYPYTLHVKEIRNEFETFLQDPKRNSMTFPPMDPHGIKTLMKFAYLYNMKSRKFGQGLKAHAVIIKNKRTFRSLPDYHNIGLLLRQRPVFNRIDQKRPRSEVEAENAKSSRRGKPSKAHVKEGDIVGAHAPEIASDNIGRRLLVKMGWSTGQGLGADNRGIPEPVVAKVKKTKLGIR